MFLVNFQSWMHDSATSIGLASVEGTGGDLFMRISGYSIKASSQLFHRHEGGCRYRLNKTHSSLTGMVDLNEDMLPVIHWSWLTLSVFGRSSFIIQFALKPAVELDSSQVFTPVLWPNRCTPRSVLRRLPATLHRLQQVALPNLTSSCARPIGLAARTQLAPCPTLRVVSKMYLPTSRCCLCARPDSDGGKGWRGLFIKNNDCALYTL